MTEVKGSNATRAAILKAAKKIFAAKGFGAKIFFAALSIAARVAFLPFTSVTCPSSV